MHKLKALIILLVVCANAHALRIKEHQVILDKLDDYANCHRKEINPDYCQDGLNNWVDAHPADTFAAAKLSRKNLFAWNALPLFVKAFDAKLGKCGDEDVKLAVIAGLGRGSSETEPISNAKKILFQYCEKELKAAAIQAANDDLTVRENLCHELSAKKWLQLTPLQIKRCK
jgi:hypothetical protein